MKHRKVKILLICLLTFVGIVLLLQHQENNQNAESEHHLKPVVINGSIVLKSFQTVENKKRTPASQESANKSANKNTPYSLQGRLSKNLLIAPPKNITSGLPAISINGLNYFWKNKKSAKRSQVIAPKESLQPDGFTIDDLATPKSEFGIYNPGSLDILTDSYGIENRVVTGAIVVRTKNYAEAKSLAKQLNVEVYYEAPQINTIIFKAKVGQNLLTLQEQIKSSPSVSKVSIEILGRGARPQ
jgi:hypothetical protein